MNDLNPNNSGYRSKAAALLNNKTFSDVEIQVNDGNNLRASFPAHKLILSMYSEEFAKIFYRNSPPLKVLKIFDFKPSTVYKMLEFIYTDQTELCNIEETKSLFILAKKFEVKDLERYCRNYFVKEKITLENIFEKYVFALSENIPSVLRACRDFASAQTMKVIRSPGFTEAPVSVVEDIFKLDTLSVMSELDLIEAAIEWAKHECFRCSAQTDNLRICIYPLFKHLRFLTLTGQEFCDLIEKYDNLINSSESTKLTMAIVQPSGSVSLPSGFSSNSSPRQPVASVLKENNLLLPETANTTFNTDGKKPWSFDSDLQDLLRDNYGLNKMAQQNSNTKSVKHDKYEAKFSQFPGKTAMKQESSSKPVNLVDFDEFSQRGLNNQIKQDFNSVKLTENAAAFSKLSSHNAPIRQNNLKPTPAIYNRSESVPICLKKSSPTIGRVYPSPQLSSNQRMFNFPLIDIDKSLGMGSSFTTDIKCSAKIFVNKGAIEIYGVELKMKQKERTPDEVMVTHLSLSGSSISSQNVTYEEKLKNSLLPLKFNPPVKLSRDQHLNIEVVVEDLILNRCSGCLSERCELNSGLNISAEIILKSNQINNDSRNFFYLFNRLIFKPLA